MHKNAKDEKGNQYKRLYVICNTESDSRGEMCWLCLCDCGKYSIVRGSSLRKGDTKSCGCLHNEELSEARTIHGLSKTKEYRRKHNAEWHKKNLERVRIKNRKSGRKYRAQKRGVEGSYTTTDLKYIYYHQQGKCPRCRESVPFEEMTVDHIIPLSWKSSNNYASNIQLLCKPCNSAKNNYHDTDYRDYVPLFLNQGNA